MRRTPMMRRTPLFLLIALCALVAAPVLAAPAISPLPFDRILRYEEMTALLRGWAAARPELVELESIGSTPGGREIWLVTLTNRRTGPALEKPAILVDGNIHATEWGGGVAALHAIWRLARDYGADEAVTRLLDSRVVYVVPRLSPDGVEATLEQGRFIRSVDRPWPPGPAEPGIHASDIDGDSRSLFMRYRDPNGPWKQHPVDPRLLVARAPDEEGGEYWRVIPEGMIEGWDGITIGDPPAREAIDLGSNFPVEREAEERNPTAGARPASEPEIAAFIAAVSKRPNIVSHVTCHTFGGLILTPPVNLDERLPAADQSVYATLAGKGAQLTGYTAMSYLDLRAEERESFIPSAFGWMYDRLGIFSFITEFWNPLEAAGISLEGTTASRWLWGYHPVEDELKLLRWSDEELDGEGFVDWRAFDHPQLGAVEIGGFDLIRYWYNIPFDRLEAEVAPHTEWLIFLGLTTPRLEIRSFAAEPLEENRWRVRLVVENSGWLPTNGSQKAIEQKVAQPVTAELSLPPGVRMISAEPEPDLRQLEGRVGQRSLATWWGYAPGTPDRTKADWVVEAPAGTRLTVHARHPRAGSARSELVLGTEVTKETR